VSALKAACEVLLEAGGPLHYREITKRILEKGLWKTSGKTPVATINAQIAVDIIKHGDLSKFIRVGKGTFALRGTKPAAKEVAPRSTAAAKKISFTDAAEKVLSEFGNNKPMHYREITNKALELGLISTIGQTPAATMYAQILTEIARSTKAGRQSRFTKHGKGFVGLTRWLGKGLAFQIEQHNREIRKKLLGSIRKMEAKRFEELAGLLLTALGFNEVEVTGRSGDGGIDVTGTLVVGNTIRTRMAVQVKRWTRNVQAPTVQQVRGSLGTHDRGLIITTSDFSAGARKEARRPNAVPVALMNGEQVVDLMMQNDIGIKRTSHDIVELAGPGEQD
jgi:restriction system protein